jgi:hypothetical protein
MAMVNVDKLRDKIIDKRMTIEGVAIDIKMDRSTLYRRFQTACGSMTINEADALRKILQLTPQEAAEIFFA